MALQTGSLPEGYFEQQLLEQVLSQDEPQQDPQSEQAQDDAPQSLDFCEANATPMADNAKKAATKILVFIKRFPFKKNN